MAKKKKEEKRFFGQMPLPKSRKRYRSIKKAWNGINLRITTDSGELSRMVGMSTKEYPYLVPAKVLRGHKKINWSPYKDDGTYVNALGLFGFEDFLIIVYRDSDTIKLDYIKNNGEIYTGTIQTGADEQDNRQRCVVQFNALDDILNPVGSGVSKRLIILPDKKTIDFYITKENLVDGNISVGDLTVETIPFTNDTVDKADDEVLTDSEYLKTVELADRRRIYRNSVTGNCYEWHRDTEADIAMWQYCVPPVFPDLDYAVVSHGRLFGVGRGRIYASGFNNYANWTFDTVDEYNESNAWCSSAQANTKADGEFIGITSYQGHILAFKKDLTYEIYNTKNPFRVIDIYGDGTVDNRTIQEVNGNLFFVSKGAVHIYTGANPKPISYNLGIDDFKISEDDYVISGTDGRNYYLWLSRWDSEKSMDMEQIFVYDTYCGQWSVLLNSYDSMSHSDYGGIPLHPVGIATNTNGVYFLRCVDKDIADDDLKALGELLTFGDAGVNDSWVFETDLMTNELYDIKHLKKLQLRAEISDNSGFAVNIIKADGTSEKVYDSNGRTGDTVVRLVLRNTASYGIKIAIEGCGYVKFHNLELIYEDGGEVNVTL